MFTLTVSLDSLSLYIVAADVLILLVYVLYLLQKKRSLEKSIKSIAEFITVYFMNTGAEVQVTCFKLEGDHHFVTLIESAPLKRFRYSNVLESSLIAHIFKTTGNVVEKIYWRFPVPLQKDSIQKDAMQEDAMQEDAIQENVIVAEEKNTLNTLVSDDLYFSDVQTLAKMQEEYNVSEVSWDEYEASKKKIEKLDGSLKRINLQGKVIQCC